MIIRVLIVLLLGHLLFQKIATAQEVALSHGPLVGGVYASSAKIWVRTNAAATMQVEFSKTPEFGDSAMSSPFVTTSGSDLTGAIRLLGLTPETDYYYRLLANGKVIPSVYRFRTSPPANSPVEFSFSILADFTADPAPVYRTVAAADPAFVVFLGDFDHRNPRTLAEMRKMHRELRGDETPAGADFSRHIMMFPQYRTWDDHDFGINNADKTFAGKQDALRAYREYHPTPPLPSNSGIWHAFIYGQAHFLMLDLRSQRDANSLTDDADKSLLGDEQKAWLKDTLLTSQSRWKFLMSSVPFNPGTKPTDSWAAFKTERNEIVEFIQKNQIKGVIVISADLHSGGAIDDGTNSSFPELSVPHANIPSCTPATGCSCNSTRRTPGQWSEGMVCGIYRPGFGHVVVAPDRVLLEARAVDGGTRLRLEVLSR